MKYTLTAPCKDCPFRTDCRPGWLGEYRSQEIIDAITAMQKTFSCHKTNDFTDEGVKQTADSQHCAGAMILLEKIKQPNQMMRIAERLGLYDYKRLKMDAPVFDSPDEFIDHHSEEF